MSPSTPRSRTLRHLRLLMAGTAATGDDAERGRTRCGRSTPEPIT